MEKKDLSINSENILPIIKKWLYSEKDIFIRGYYSDYHKIEENTK